MGKLINFLKMFWIVSKYAVRSCIIHFCNPNGRWLKDVCFFDTDFNKAKVLNISRFQYRTRLAQDIRAMVEMVNAQYQEVVEVRQ